MSKSQKKTNTTQWDAKIQAILRKNKEKLPGLVDEIHDVVKEAVVDYVGGDYIKVGIPGSDDGRIGNVPIPRRSAALSRSIKSLKINPLKWKLWSDGRIAPHNVPVHDGAKLTSSKGKTTVIKARPFIKEPIEKKKAFVKAFVNMNAIKWIRSVGRSR